MVPANLGVGRNAGGSGLIQQLLRRLMGGQAVPNNNPRAAFQPGTATPPPQGPPLPRNPNNVPGMGGVLPPKMAAAPSLAMVPPRRKLPAVRPEAQFVGNGPEVPPVGANPMQALMDSNEDSQLPNFENPEPPPLDSNVIQALLSSQGQAQAPMLAPTNAVGSAMAPAQHSKMASFFRALAGR